MRKAASEPRSFLQPKGRGSPASSPAAFNTRRWTVASSLRKSFSADLRNLTSYRAIPFQPGFDVGERDGRLVPAPCDDREILQIFQEFLVFRDGENHSRGLPVFHDILGLGVQCFHHGESYHRAAIWRERVHMEMACHLSF